MTKTECQRLIDEYLRWLKQELKVTKIEDSCHISTPFLDRHNDAIEIYVEKKDGALRLTDDGYTIRDLRATGMEFTTEKRKAHLHAVLNGFGVKLEDDEICITASLEDFPQKKHNLVQALLAVNDMFVMAEEHVLSLFKEDVALFLEAHRIPAFSDFKLSGKSGFDHKFDFGLPKTIEKPQRILQTINNLTKDNATSLAFALADVQAIRTDPIGALAMINDSLRPPNEEHLAALRAYEIEPLLWSNRETAVSVLNGTPFLS
ncbi:MAG: DUF1828 domain-containing protein [Deltaproteobacteria bacterium]|nr:DUF1828 domain-containing protein [Deltaproteobacteria bacterium]